MTPKQLFQTDLKATARHARLADDIETEKFLTTAFAEYAYTLPGGNTPQHAWDANSRRQGAKEFIQVFLSLSKSPQEPKPDMSALQPEP